MCSLIPILEVTQVVFILALKLFAILGILVGLDHPQLADKDIFAFPLYPFFVVTTMAPLAEFIP